MDLPHFFLLNSISYLGAQCKMRATGGCPTCKRIWALLQIHARQCQVSSGCLVPRCHDLKAHLRRMRNGKEKNEETINEKLFLSICHDVAHLEAGAASSAPPKFVPTWHQNKEDLPLRRNMITQIVHLLQKRKPNAPPEWLKKIPDMARRLEDSLYRAANTREIYTDMKTLKHRLHGVAQTYQRLRSKQANGGQRSSSSTCFYFFF